MLTTAGVTETPPRNHTQTNSGMPDTVQRAQLGDHDAFREIYEQNIQRIYAIILRMCTDSIWAEELTQKAFVRAWEMIGTFRGEGSFGGWLQRLAVNVVLLDFRSKKRRMNRIQFTSELFVYDKPVQTNDVFHAMDLENAIAGLPRKARLVFVLHDVEGFRHDEIAQMMGISSGTTKAQLHRARRLLREALNR